MRLLKGEREKAKADLLEILLKGPRKTSELQATPHYHGGRTLSLVQIRTLLKETGKVDERIGRQGIRTWSEWRLKNEAREEIQKAEKRHLAWHNEHGERYHNLDAWKERIRG